MEMPNNSSLLITKEIDPPINETSENNIINSTPFSIFTYEPKENRINDDLIQSPSINQNRNNNALYNSFEAPLNQINYNDNINNEQELSQLRKKLNDDQTIIMSLKEENQQKDIEIMRLRSQLLNNTFLRENQILRKSTPNQISNMSLNNNYPINLEENIYNTITPNINDFNNTLPSLDVYSNTQNSTNILENASILDDSVLVGSV